MNKWVLDIKQSQDFIAVSKPKSDISEITSTIGYTKYGVHRHDTRDMDDNELHRYVSGWLEAVDPGDFFIYQYPSLVGRSFDEMAIEILNAKGAKVILLIHDAESIRGIKYDGEITLMNKCDVIIGHSDPMNQELRLRGLTKPIVNKDMFDYLIPDSVEISDKVEKKLAVAGNLAKSIFINKWTDEDVELHAFGPKNEDDFPGNVIYHGAIIQKELQREMPKDAIGMCWDDKLPGGGNYQQYTQFNSPHKFSLYLGLGLPVVVWDQSAMAKIVKKNNLGICVESPRQITEVLNNTSLKQLDLYKKNALTMRNLIRNGMFTKHAILDAESILLRS